MNMDDSREQRVSGHAEAVQGQAERIGGAARGESAGERVEHAGGADNVSAKGHAAGEAREGGRRYGRPTGAGAARRADGAAQRGAHGTGKARHTVGDARDGERRYGKPIGTGTATRYGNDVARHSESRASAARHAAGEAHQARDGERRYAKPAITAATPYRGEHRPAIRRPSAPRGAAAPGPNARRVALDVLTDVHQDGAYAALALDKRLRAGSLRPEDRRLATSLVYGTLENELRLDFALDSLMDHPTHEAVQRDILRMGAYQILLLDRVPDSAAVNEAVKLVRAIGMEAASGFINAVLRNLSRGKDEIAWPKREDDVKQYLSVMGSMPMWLTERLIADYGVEEAERVILYREREHPIVVRPNMTRLTDAEFERLLSGKVWRVERGLAPHAWLVHGAADIAGDADFRSGLFSIQGQSSMLAAEAIQAKPGMKVLDACAAPGGKSAYLCEMMQMTGRVYAWELHEKRAALLDSMRRRLRLDNLRVSVRDACEPRPDLYGTLDAVLLDAPCTGLGVLAQKPDVKLRLKPEDIPAIVDTQKRLLDTVCRYVREGGTLVYSTCSLLPEENALQVRAFLREHPNFTLETLPLTFPEELRRRQTPDGLQLLGCRDGVEGFFIARMRRVR